LLVAAEGFALQPRLAVSDLAREADVIVKAKVEDIHTAPTRDGATLTTLVTLAVEEVWKGAPARQITVAVRGGTAGDIAQGDSGEPRFTSGERAVLFLKAKSERYAIVARRQGKFTILIGIEGQEVAQDITGVRHDIGQLRAEVRAAGR